MNDAPKRDGRIEWVDAGTIYIMLCKNYENNGDDIDLITDHISCLETENEELRKVICAVVNRLHEGRAFVRPNDAAAASRWLMSHLEGLHHVQS